MIKELIQALADDGAEQYGKVCKVVSIDGLVCECEPIDESANILDVRLIADESTNRFVLKPKVGSLVIVEFLDKSNAFISMVSEVDEVLYKIDSVEYSVTDEGFLLKKGNDTLKQIIQLIIEATQQIVVVQGNNPDYQKLAQALQKLNNLCR